MNRRALLTRLGAAGLVAATIDAPRFWAIDQTMLAPPEPTYTIALGDGDALYQWSGIDDLTARLCIESVTGHSIAGDLAAWLEEHHWEKPLVLADNRPPVPTWPRLTVSVADSSLCYPVATFAPVAATGYRMTLAWESHL